MKNAKTTVPLAKRRSQIARLYLRGRTQAQIAAETGTSQPKVSRDLIAIERKWGDSGIRDFDAARAEQLAKIEEVERACWEAWHRSIGVAKTETVKVRSECEETRTELRGDPRYLSPGDGLHQEALRTAGHRCAEEAGALGLCRWT